MSIQKKIGLVLSTLLGAFFIFSAYTKTSPNLNYFEFTIKSQLHFPEMLAAISARILVGLELALGVLLLFGITGKRKWIPRTSLILLILFSIHLLILYLSEGNDVNCGCMGDMIPMSPLVSLLKNIGLIIINYLILRTYSKNSTGKFNNPSIFIALILVVLPFTIFPIGKEKELDIQQIYIVNPLIHPNIQLEKGKHIVAFLSLGCGHCKQAVADMEQMYQQNKEIPFYLLFQKLGQEEEEKQALENFQIESGTITIPYSFLDRFQFIQILREQGLESVPSIFWIDDDNIFRVTSGHDLNQKDIELWIK